MTQTSPSDTLPDVRGRLTPNRDLSALTWLRVGGPADVLFQPADLDDLQQFLRALPPERVKCSGGRWAEGHWLEISWPLHKLVLQARDEKHCAKWVQSVESRKEHWKRQYEVNGVRTATPVFGVPNGSEPAAHWRVSGRADTRRGW